MRRTHAVGRSPSAMLAALAFLVAPALATAQAPTRSQSTPFALRAHTTFGAESACGRPVPLLVTVTNSADTVLRAQLVVELENRYVHVGARGATTTSLPVEVPAHGSREVAVTLGRQFGVDIALVVAGAVAASTRLECSEQPVVVLLDEAPALETLLEQVTLPRRSADTIAVSPATRDPVSGDRIFPEDAQGWSMATAVVGSVEAFDALTEAQRRDVGRSVVLGGTLVLMTDREAERGTAFIDGLWGPIERDDASLPAHPLLPSATIRGLRCPPGTELWFGCGTPVGDGLAYLVAFDGSRRPFADDPVVAHLLAVLLDTGQTHAESVWFPATPMTFAALDPNHVSLRWLPLLCAVLGFYVLAVGPLSFMWARRRGRPLLVLVTTPAFAALMFAVTVSTGVFEKGLRHRRAAAQLDVVDVGGELVVRRALDAYFFAHPDTLAVQREPASLPSIVPDARGTLEQTSEGWRFGNVSVGTWQSRLVEHTELIELGGRFRTTTGRLEDGAILTNDTPLRLESAVLVRRREIAPLGALAPGSSVTLPVDDGTWEMGPTALATALGYTDGDLAVATAIAIDLQPLTDGGGTMIVARVVADVPPIGAFALERSVRVVVILERNVEVSTPDPSAFENVLGRERSFGRVFSEPWEPPTTTEDEDPSLQENEGAEPPSTEAPPTGDEGGAP